LNDFKRLQKSPLISEMTYPFLAFPDPSKGASAPRIPRPASSLVFKRAKHPEFADFDVNHRRKTRAPG